MNDVPADPRRLRVSDQERHVVAEVLREAAAEGRIDLDELEERLEATYAARTYGDLVPLTADLPAHQRPGATLEPRQPVRPPVPVPSYSTSFALMAETRRAGVWEVGATHTAVALMGGVVIDLRRARFAEREVTIHAHAVMGGVEIVVNPQTVVVVEGIGVMGGFGEARSKVEAEPGPASPVVRVKGLALMGAVEVKRKKVS